MRNTSKLPMTLMPKVPGLNLENAAIDTDSVEFTLTSTSLPVTCPACEKQTARLHSHYGRMAADLPWGGRRVRLVLNVRKFRCPHKECSRRVFTERLPDLVAPYARKTTRLHEVLDMVGFAMGGKAGARLIGRLGMEASPTTLLRYIRGAVIASHPAPEVVGVDDFACQWPLRRGTYTVSAYPTLNKSLSMLTFLRTFRKRPTKIPDPGQLILLRIPNGTWTGPFRALSKPDTIKGEEVIWVAEEGEFWEALYSDRRVISMSWPVEQMKVWDSPRP